MATIDIRNVSKIFGPSPTKVLPRVEAGEPKETILAETGHTVGLRDISLSMETGKTFVVMGLSGSGKSTLIRHINRLIEPTAGRIEVDGEDVMALSGEALRALRRTRMSMVFQRFGLLPHRRVIDNVAYGLEIQRVAKTERMRRATEWIEAVELAGYERSYPSQLSGGMQQRVGLARALCTGADILLMDEAFSALDPLIRSGMQDQLIALQEKLAKTIVFITHDLDEALKLGDRIAILKDGALSQVGRPEEILLAPADDYVAAFVRDVNRARVLTAEVVMRAPPRRLTTENIEAALMQMRGAREDYGYVFDGNVYAGVVTQAALEAALTDAGGAPDWSSIARETPTVTPDAILEEILPATLECDFPVPVVTDDGEFKGVVSRRKLVSVLSQHARSHKADRDEETPRLT